MQTLNLYYRPTCPYCLKVLKFMKENKIELPLKDIGAGNNRDELLKIGGKQQVPCLVIDGKAMYESGDIIDWLKSNIN